MQRSGSALHMTSMLLLKTGESPNKWVKFARTFQRHKVRCTLNRGLPTALCRDKRKHATRCEVTADLGIVPDMRAIGMSPFAIDQHVSAATSESHFQASAVRDKSRVSAIRLRSCLARAISQSSYIPILRIASVVASSSATFASQHRHITGGSNRSRVERAPV
jgi:hypothetical protein